VLTLVERLEQEGLSHCLHLMHFHLGSQLANIRDIQAGLKEAARYYGELRGLGVPLADVDVGGGLGVDYEGTSCRSFCSMNYGIGEYANNVVHALWESCEAEGLPHPNLLTESGRAMTAHHAMLITEVVDVAVAPGEEEPPAAREEEPLVIQDLRRTLGQLSRRNAVESYHDATNGLAEAQTMFNHGILDLPGRAVAEGLYGAVCQRARRLLNPESRGHREILDDLEERFADKYICNLSLFQSLPDIWAIDQIFPVVPLHRLDEPPGRNGILHDLTCDSDGQVEHYVGRDGVASTLPLHPLRPGERYLLGVFLVGAYQEILGDIHNLFGDTHSVNVELTGDGGHRLSEPVEGESVSDVLATVGYRSDDLFAAYLARAREAGLPAAETRAYLAELRQGLAGYTYLED
jgi:arginine decarboxylase